MNSDLFALNLPRIHVGVDFFGGEEHKMSEQAVRSMLHAWVHEAQVDAKKHMLHSVKHGMLTQREEQEQRRLVSTHGSGLLAAHSRLLLQHPSALRLFCLGWDSERILWLGLQDPSSILSSISTELLIAILRHVAELRVSSDASAWLSCPDEMD